ncbi:hypothetical protein NL108_016956, partial [Boleophthalmus pectinirostris]
EAIMDGTEVAVSPRALHSELMCPICLDMLKDTMTTKECLHRFCSDCIVTALRSGFDTLTFSTEKKTKHVQYRIFICFFLFSNKECPTCRKKLVSRRSLRKDSNFDALISKIYPSRDEYEAHQRRVIERLNRLHNQEALSSSIEEGLRQQARYRAERNHRVKKPTQESDNTTFSGGEDNGDSRSHLSHDSAPSHAPPVAGHTWSEAGPSRKRARPSEEGSGHEADSGRTTPPPRRHKDGPVSEIELVFRPHPQLVQPNDYSQTRYVKTTANATVDHLSKYLALRIALEEGPSAGEAEEAPGAGAERGPPAAAAQGSSLQSVSEKQYTIYIMTKGQFS